jgi:hypothetical protein
MNKREKQIVCGLFLSKFDRMGLEYLGFESFSEAFNAIGYGLQARPASIKNYRDELDPFFPNERKGWHKRPLRTHCRKILDEYKDADIDRLGEVVKGFLLPVDEVESMPEVKRVLSIHDSDGASSFAKRLITGKAAEQYFSANCTKMPEFEGFRATNTTAWGCGFDFKLASESGDSYRAVEVKGLRTRCGQIQMTQLEHDMADALLDAYYLVVVRNFVETPFHTIVRNPVRSSLTLTRVERPEVRVSWSVSVDD